MKTTNTTNYVLVALGLACGILLALLLRAKADLAAEIEQQKELSKHERQLVGSTVLWSGSNGKPVNYNLRSFDDGVSWVAVEYDDDWRMKIKGDAEELYPGLVAQIRGLNRLTERMQGSGKVDLSRPEDRQLVESAGFTVVQKN